MSLRRLQLSRVAPGLLAAAVLTPLAAGNGGYFPPAWGWSAAAFLWAAAVAALVRSRLDVTLAELVTVSAFGLLTIWTLLSATWSGDTTSAVLSTERILVYVAGLLALLLVSRRGSISSLLVGVLIAITFASTYGLLGRLFPSTTAAGGIANTGRLAAPVGYWNGLGILCAMGAIVALGLAAHSRSVGGRIAAAATLPPVVVALYFTYSRGAWIAVAFGLVAAIAIERRRWLLLLTILGTLPWLALDVALGATSSALTHAASPVGPTAHQGHRLAAVLVVSIIGIAATVWAIHRLEPRLEPSQRATRIGHISTIAVAVVLILVALVRFGSPVTIATDMYNRFNAPPPGGFSGTAGHVGRNLNLRLFSLSGNARADLWRIAWKDAKAHPALGSGADTYERYYLQHRSNSLKVRNAHNLYLETLADLGPVGLVLLLAGLLVPLGAAFRSRHEALVPAAFGALAAFMLHAGADWDWQLTAVTLCALACGVGLLTSLPETRWSLPLGTRAVKIALTAAIVVVAASALIGLRGNTADAASQRAADGHNWVSAEQEARTAVTWEPWSAGARIDLGVALAGQGRLAEARMSFRAAIARDPRSWLAWFDLAHASSGAQRSRALARATQLDPNEPQVVAANAAS